MRGLKTPGAGKLLGGPAARKTPLSTATQTLRVEADSRVKGVTLFAAPPDGPPGAPMSDDAALLLQFSPDLVLFPDATPRASAPFKDGRHDYHPRPVEAFLDGAHPYVATPGGPLGLLYVASSAAIVVTLGLVLLFLLTSRFDAVWALVPVLAVAAAAAFVTWLVLWSATPASPEDVRLKIARREDTTRLGIRRSTLDLLQRVKAWQAWLDYRTRIVGSARYPRAAYGRVVGEGDDRYLQYWQLYVFNDWHNVHEADFEVVVVRVHRTADGWAPRAAAYSSHFGGHWRIWEDLESREGTHPIVYVVKGSHAQYFESRPEGYRATLTQPLALLEYRIKLIVQNDWTDVVAASTGTVRQPYELRVIPADLNAEALREDHLEAWWWLAYDGLWGDRDAISGPASQGTKWSDPLAWVRVGVDRDLGDVADFAMEAPV